MRKCTSIIACPSPPFTLNKQQSNLRQRMAYEGEEEAHAEAVEKRGIPGVCTADGRQDEARKNKQGANAKACGPPRQQAGGDAEYHHAGGKHLEINGRFIAPRTPLVDERQNIQ